MRSVIIKARALELGDSEMERANPAVERAGFSRRGVTNAPAVLSLPGAYYGRTTPRHNDLVQTLFSGDHAAQPMHAEHIQRVVNPQLLLDKPGRDATQGPGHEADHHGADWSDIARGRGDRRQTGDAARGDADRGPPAQAPSLDRDPGETRRGGGKLGREDRRSGRVLPPIL